MTKTLIIFISILLYGCNEADINNTDKRNENWIYWIDKNTGKASWVPITDDETTLKDGRYTMFYSKGSIYKKGKLKDGKDIDTLYFYDLNEKLIQYLLVKSNAHYYLKNGPYISYSQNGKIFEKGIIENHQIGSEWTSYFENGKVDWTKKLTNGTGWNYWYYKNGQISAANYHVKGKTNGEVNTWYENGQIKEISHWKNGVQDGSFEFFYENGKIQERTNWVNGKTEGKSESWYDNGSKKNIKFYKNGLLDGNIKQWYPSGNLNLDAHYSLGQKNGKAILYYENGNLQVEQFFKNEQRNGVCIWYNKKGKLIKKENYINGQLVE